MMAIVCLGSVVPVAYFKLSVLWKEISRLLTSPLVTLVFDFPNPVDTHSTPSDKPVDSNVTVLTTAGFAVDIR